jgi:glycosyltransferase involved in cell wall biosynthesis
MPRELSVTVVIPVFNGERYLGEAIESVLAQSSPAQEIVVIDDGSTDRSAEIATSYGKVVRCVRQDNAGCVAARNRGIEEARGELIALLDADDSFSPEKLALQREHFTRRPELGVSMGHARHFASPDLAADEVTVPPHLAPPRPDLVITWLVRRRVFDQVGLFSVDHDHVEVAEWFTRSRDAGVVMETLPEVLAARRLHPASLSATRSERKLDAVFDLVGRRLAARQRGRVDEGDGSS